MQNALSGRVYSTNDDYSWLCAIIEYNRFADITSRPIGVNLDLLAFGGLRDMNVAARNTVLTLYLNTQSEQQCLNIDNVLGVLQCIYTQNVSGVCSHM